MLSRTDSRQMIVTACEIGDYLKLSDVNMIYVEKGEYRVEAPLPKGSCREATEGYGFE